MNRVLSLFARAALAAAVLLALTAPARADYSLTQVFYIPPGGNCAATACTSGARLMCRDSSTSTAVYVCNASTHFYVAVPTGGAPGGSSGQVQLNSGGSFAGDAGLTYSPATGTLTATALSSGAQRRPGLSTTMNDGALQLLPLQADFTMAAPSSAPTGGATGGIAACTNGGGLTYQICVTALNQSGETTCSPTLSFATSGTSKQIQGITRPSLPAAATHWRMYYAKSTEAFANWYPCDVTVGGAGSTRVAPYFAAATTQGACNCAAGSAATIANTTGPVTMLDPRDGEIRFNSGWAAVAEGSTSPVQAGLGTNRIYFRSTGIQMSADAGGTTQNIVNDAGAYTFPQAQTFSGGLSSPALIANVAPSARGPLKFPYGVQNLGPAAMIGLAGDNHGQSVATVKTLVDQYQLPYTVFVQRGYRVLSVPPPHTSGGILANAELASLAADPYIEIGTHGNKSHTAIYTEYASGKTFTDGGGTAHLLLRGAPSLGTNLPGWDPSTIATDIVANDFIFLFGGGAPRLVTSVDGSGGNQITMNRTAQSTLGTGTQPYLINRATVGTSLSQNGLTMTCDAGAGVAGSTLSWTSAGVDDQGAGAVGFRNAYCLGAADPYPCCTGNTVGTCDTDNIRGNVIWIDGSNPATDNPFYVTDYVTGPGCGGSAPTANCGQIRLDKQVTCTAGTSTVHISPSPLAVQEAMADGLAWIRHDLGNPSYPITSWAAPGNGMSVHQILPMLADGIRSYSGVVNGKTAGFNALHTFSRFSIDRDGNLGLMNRWLAAPEGLRNAVRAAEDTGAALVFNLESDFPDANCYVSSETMSGTSGGTTATCAGGSCTFCGLSAGSTGNPFYLVVDTPATARSYKISAFPGSGQLTVTPAFDGTFSGARYWILQELIGAGAPPQSVNSQMPKQTLDALMSFVASERDAGRVMPLTMTALADRASTMRDYDANLVQNPQWRETASSCTQTTEPTKCKGQSASTAFAPWGFSAGGDKVSAVQRGGHTVLKVDTSGGSASVQFSQPVNVRPNTDYVGFVTVDVESLTSVSVMTFDLLGLQFAPARNNQWDNAWTPNAGTDMTSSGTPAGGSLKNTYYGMFRFSTKAASAYYGQVTNNGTTCAASNSIGVSSSLYSRSGTGICVLQNETWAGGMLTVTPTTADCSCVVTNATDRSTVTCVDHTAAAKDCDFNFIQPVPPIDADDSPVGDRRTITFSFRSTTQGVFYVHPVVIVPAHPERQLIQ